MNPAVARLGAALLSVLVLLVFVSADADAFIIPSDPTVGEGSEWVYRSNLGETRVRMLVREPIASGVERFRWDLQVAGLRYTEDLLLTSGRLGVTWRRLAGFGIVRRDFSFSDPELVMELPLEAGQTWSWSGPAVMGKREGTATAAGEVLGIETVNVPAGTFETIHIRLTRGDSFGTRQEIDLWFNPEIGPIKATGDLRWDGLIGFVQRLVGLDRFEVELASYSIVRTSLGFTQ